MAVRERQRGRAWIGQGGAEKEKERRRMNKCDPIQSIPFCRSFSSRSRLKGCRDRGDVARKDATNSCADKQGLD